MTPLDLPPPPPSPKREREQEQERKREGTQGPTRTQERERGQGREQEQKQKREQKVPLFVIDASALLAAFLPEEEWEAEADALLDAYQEGKLQLVAPTLLPYEILNSLYLAVRGKAGRPPRIGEAEAYEAWGYFIGLGIPLLNVVEGVEAEAEAKGEGVAIRVLERAFRHRWRSIYDLAYLAWAERLNTKLITADPALVREKAFRKWVHPLWEPLSL